MHTPKLREAEGTPSVPSLLVFFLGRLGESADCSSWIIRPGMLHKHGCHISSVFQSLCILVEVA